VPGSQEGILPAPAAVPPEHHQQRMPAQFLVGQAFPAREGPHTEDTVSNPSWPGRPAYLNRYHALPSAALAAPVRMPTTMLAWLGVCSPPQREITAVTFVPPARPPRPPGSSGRCPPACGSSHWPAVANGGTPPARPGQPTSSARPWLDRSPSGPPGSAAG